MHPFPTSANPYPDCYLQIRRGKQTIFTDVSETTTVGELKQILANVLKITPEIIAFTAKGQALDIDGKSLLEYGIVTKEARPQTPFQLEFVLQADDGTFETQEIVPYTTENQSTADDLPPIGNTNDSK